jgi:hypothetical protein
MFTPNHEVKMWKLPDYPVGIKSEIFWYKKEVFNHRPVSITILLLLESIISIHKTVTIAGSGAW